mmetsp:Transcript_5789/g.16317  ORF Transcript_5789/g.16317 Transcript_5789/m.16317 type:complete len:258 (-) Transcript_5789:465-1238(-)
MLPNHRFGITLPAHTGGTKVHILEGRLRASSGVVDGSGFSRNILSANKCLPHQSFRYLDSKSFGEWSPTFVAGIVINDGNADIGSIPPRHPPLGFLVGASRRRGRGRALQHLFCLLDRSGYFTGDLAKTIRGLVSNFPFAIKDANFGIPRKRFDGRFVFVFIDLHKGDVTTQVSALCTLSFDIQAFTRATAKHHLLDGLRRCWTPNRKDSGTSPHGQDRAQKFSPCYAAVLLYVVYTARGHIVEIFQYLITRVGPAE